jgi:hypothetical protein
MHVEALLIGQQTDDLTWLIPEVRSVLYRDHELKLMIVERSHLQREASHSRSRPLPRERDAGKALSFPGWLQIIQTALQLDAYIKSSNLSPAAGFSHHKLIGLNATSNGWRDGF